MRRIFGLVILGLVMSSCCPLVGVIQEAVNQIKDLTSGIDEPVIIDVPENVDEVEIITPEVEIEEPFDVIVNPCEGIYQKYPHDPSLGEIKEDYVGSWHTDPSLSASWNERFVFFPSGNYLFFPSQYECTYSSDPNCTPTPIEDGLWGVKDNVMYFAKSGDMSNILPRPITPLVPSSIDESPYPYKTTIDGMPFWLYSKDTNYWDPETGEYCGW